MILVGLRGLKFDVDKFDLSHVSSTWIDCLSLELPRVKRKNFTSGSGHGRSTIHVHGPILIWARGWRGPSTNAGRPLVFDVASIECSTELESKYYCYRIQLERKMRKLTKYHICNGCCEWRLPSNNHFCKKIILVFSTDIQNYQIKLIDV